MRMGRSRKCGEQGRGLRRHHLQRATMEPPGKAYVYTLRLRLSAAPYRRLRRYVAAHEDRTGRRLTHQAIIEAALSEYLDRHGA